jgi:hypothetical protein
VFVSFQILHDLRWPQTVIFSMSHCDFLWQCVLLQIVLKVTIIKERCASHTVPTCAGDKEMDNTHNISVLATVTFIACSVKNIWDTIFFSIQTVHFDWHFFSSSTKTTTHSAWMFTWRHKNHWRWFWTTPPSSSPHPLPLLLPQLPPLTPAQNQVCGRYIF